MSNVAGCRESIVFCSSKLVYPMLLAYFLYLLLSMEIKSKQLLVLFVSLDNFGEVPSFEFCHIVSTIVSRFCKGAIRSCEFLVKFPIEGFT